LGAPLTQVFALKYNFPPQAGFLFSQGEYTNMRVAVTSLWAEDMNAAAHFYRDVIGLSGMPHHAGERLYFDLDGSYLAIVPGRPALPPDPEPRFPVVAFSVRSLQAAVKRLLDHGVSLPWGVETNSDCRWVMFRDPAGNLVELVEFDDAG
jgi:catechol 2,3-dioxygenase-like lactoylglutathione lyase family enzyme